MTDTDDRELAISLGRSAAVAAHDARFNSGLTKAAHRRGLLANCEAEQLSPEMTKLALSTFNRVSREIVAERKRS